jgi:hypothetical protein
MAQYRKKPVVIDAVQYDGNFRCLDCFSINEVGQFIIGTDDAGNPCLKIPTLEGVMIASKGDYIIRGVKGEYYPCKPDIFEMTYEAIKHIATQQTELEKAISIIKNEFKNDIGYRESWKANIAMAYKDCEHWYKKETGKKQLNKEDKHFVANMAAEHFLNLHDSEITEQGKKEIEAKAELVPPERTMELCKAVLEYLGSRLNQDIEPKPSLNSVACLAADIMKELRHDEFDFSKKQVQEKTCICNSCKKEGKNDFMPNGLLLFFPIVYRLKNGEIPHNGLEYVAGGYYCGYLCRDCFFAKLDSSGT